MGEPHVISALARKHAELAGEIAVAERRLAPLRADLVHLEGALRVFDPEYHVDGIRPKRLAPRDEHFAPGELARLMLDTLRTATWPLTSREMARRMLTGKGLDAGDTRLLSIVDRRVSGYLRRGGAALVDAVKGDGAARWRGGPSAKVSFYTTYRLSSSLGDSESLCFRTGRIGRSAEDAALYCDTRDRKYGKVAN